MTTVVSRKRFTSALAMALVVSGFSPPALAQQSTSHRDAEQLTRRLELMLRTMRITREWHIGRPGRPELINGAIEGLLARIDVEAELYRRPELRRIARFTVAAEGKVGLDLKREPAPRRLERPGYRVVSSRDASPAAAAGLKAGDLVTHVDGRPAGELSYLTMMHVVLRGAPGTSVRLTIEREGETEPVELALVRSGDSGPPVVIDEVTPGVTRVRLAAVDAGAARSLELLDSTAGSRGIVLDLRSTSEGDLEGARAAADAFLETGPLVRTTARAPARGREDIATPGDVAGGRPLVVLVDRGTGGAAEVFAAALKETRRARVVGLRTAGRGALRALLPLGARGEKGMLRLTTERLKTPSGADLDGKGVDPDIVAEQSPSSPRCRTVDIEDKEQAGRCIARTVAEDGQLARAIALLDEALVVSRGATSEAKH